MSAAQTSGATSCIERLNILPWTRTGLQYRPMQIENPPTRASALPSLPVMGWMRFAKDLHDGRIEQLRELHAGNTAEGKDTLTAKKKKQHFDEQSRDSLKSRSFYDVLLEHKDVIPRAIPAELW
ncbi:hypothetical protein PInf_007845 [Phytophthora infestans]|nr:hypothetical protein PInf_007845 [Phytophthora infestans]